MNFQVKQDIHKENGSGVKGFYLIHWELIGLCKVDKVGFEEEFFQWQYEPFIFYER